MSQARRFCFTSFAEKPFVFDDTYYNYMCYQHEVCPTTLRQHWQGYFETLTKRMASAVLKRLRREVGEGVSIKLFICDGSFDQNKAYCSKSETSIEGTFQEFGVPMHQGERSDLRQYIDAVLKEDKDDEHLMINYTDTWARHPHLAARARLIARKKVATSPRDVAVIWLYGPPGTGKTHRAIEEAVKRFGTFFIVPSPDWFDGYDGQRCIIVDDLAPSEMRRNMLLRLTDKWPLQLPIKGSFVWACHTCVIITSNFHHKEFNLPPLTDRITATYQLDGESRRNGWRKQVS